MTEGEFIKRLENDDSLGYETEENSSNINIIFVFDVDKLVDLIDEAKQDFPLGKIFTLNIAEKGTTKSPYYFGFKPSKDMQDLEEWFKKWFGE